MHILTQRIETIEQKLDERIVTSSKIGYVSVLQSIAILLVVLGHSYPPGAIYPLISTTILKYIGSFHMPLFMTLSGFLFFYNGGIRYNYLNFVKKKTYRLFLPYIILSSLAFLPKVILSKYAVRPIEGTMDSFINNIIFPWDNVIIYFWFLPTLLMIFLISPILNWVCKKNNMWIIGMSMGLFLLHLYNPCNGIKILNLEGVISYLIYFWLGCLIAKFKSIFENKIMENRLLLASMFSITIILNIFEHTNGVLNFLVATAGIIMIFQLSQIYVINRWEFLDFMQGCSYSIYLLSWFPQTFFNIVAYKIFDLGFYTSALLMFASGILIPIIIVKVVKKRKLKYSFIIGI